MRVGFIGLGNVGSKLSGSLLRNGFDVMVRDLNQDFVDEFVARGAVAANSPKEMAEACDSSLPAYLPLLRVLLLWKMTTASWLALALAKYGWK